MISVDKWNIFYGEDGVIVSAHIETGKAIARYTDGELDERFDPNNPNINPYLKPLAEEYQNAVTEGLIPLQIEPESPTPEPPDWNIFKGWAVTSSTVELVLSNLTSVQQSMIVTAFSLVGEQQSWWPDIINLWNMAISKGSLTSEEKQAISTEVNQVIQASNIFGVIAINDQAFLYNPNA